MNNDDLTPDVSVGCFIVGLIFFGFLLLIFLPAKDCGGISFILACICIYLAYGLIKALKTKKTIQTKSEEVRALQTALNKELTNWPAIQRMTIDEHSTGKTTMLQISGVKRKFSILRYDMLTRTADYRVYHFKELTTWHAHVEKQQTPTLLGPMQEVCAIAIIFNITYNNQQFKHKINLYRGEPLSPAALSIFEKKLKDIQSFLTHIKPESH